MTPDSDYLAAPICREDRAREITTRATSADSDSDWSADHSAEDATSDTTASTDALSMAATSDEEEEGREVVPLHVRIETNVPKVKGVRLWRLVCPAHYFLGAGDNVSIHWSRSHDKDITETFTGSLDSIWATHRSWIVFTFLGHHVPASSNPGKRCLIRARITCPLIWAYFGVELFPEHVNRPWHPRADSVPPYPPHWASLTDVELMNRYPCDHIECYINRAASTQEDVQDPRARALSPALAVKSDTSQGLPNAMEAACVELGIPFFCYRY
ncbi:hypothetical protein BC834DRAFT_900971 [Gloeopeniophorella convolvens]|nr:hypothetical protein BC834DRAFT_900971 [Gloeopeniophorella convolvens]